jgi:hypothetical protein
VADNWVCISVLYIYFNLIGKFNGTVVSIISENYVSYS